MEMKTPQETHSCHHKSIRNLMSSNVYVKGSGVWTSFTYSQTGVLDEKSFEGTTRTMCESELLVVKSW